MKLSRLVMGSAVAASLVGAGFTAMPASAQDCVTVYGGDVLNETVIDINANAGTSISDASAGSNNLATTGGGGGGDGEVFNIASARNGGVATSAANGGAISVGNINSGGNVGNAISVGDTYCAVDAYAPEEPVYEDVAAEEVVALPDTGVGAGEVGSLFALLASAGAAAASFGLRRR
jgi:hypothetical protein